MTICKLKLRMERADERLGLIYPFFLRCFPFVLCPIRGADFGAGILELSLSGKDRDEERQLISQAMAPVWEANHVWLILAVVILFMGFPEIYVLIATYLYIPLMAVLAGIVARGCAFTFRYYDTLEKNFYRTYSRVFSISSVWTSFFLGVTAGALMLGRISTTAPDFWSAYVFPWFNWFCAAVGIFACTLFSFIASVYLTGEARSKNLRSVFLMRVKAANLFVVIAGAIVFASAEYEGFRLMRTFFTNRASAVFFILASALWIPFWMLLRKPDKTVLLRFLAALIVSAVMLGWFAAKYPIALQTLDRGGLSFMDAAAPEPTLKALLGALLFGSALIFPALFYLFKIFKSNSILR